MKISQNSKNEIWKCCLVNIFHYSLWYVNFGCQFKDIQNTPEITLKYSLYKLQSPVWGGGFISQLYLTLNQFPTNFLDRLRGVIMRTQYRVYSGWKLAGSLNCFSLVVFHNLKFQTDFQVLISFAGGAHTTIIRTAHPCLSPCKNSVIIPCISWSYSIAGVVPTWVWSVCHQPSSEGSSSLLSPLLARPAGLCRGGIGTFPTLATNLLATILAKPLNIQS